MDVEINQTSNAQDANSSPTNSPPSCIEDAENRIHSCSESFAMIIQQLADNAEVLCRLQQRDEKDITRQEKIKILSDILEKSKPNFLARFGPFLTQEQAQLFEQFQDDPKDGYEVMYHLKTVSQMHSDRRRHKQLRNKRYAALKRLVEKDSYFSEIEMMRRNPLLYEQLVGRYLSPKEKKLRDRQVSRGKTFVGVLMDGIESEQAEAKRKKQEQAEDAAMEKGDSDSDSSDSDDYGMKASGSNRQVSRVFWGEIQEDVPTRIKPPLRDSELSITAQERKILKEEFVSSMYQSFLDGEDDDFDYEAVDNNDEYDNLEILAHDEEEKYFDSEEPEDMTMAGDAKPKDESSEDELDIYMNALNQHPVVCQLSEDLKKL